MDTPPHLPDISGYVASPCEPEGELRRLFRTDRPLVIFDIGACEGEDSIRYARLFPHARIYAFEPLPANQAVIQANLKRYGIPGIELVPLALSNQRGEARFHVSSGRPRELFSGADWNYGNKSSSLLPPATSEPMHGWIKFSEDILVQTETLDAFCAARGIHHIDFIHMDVQGAEHLVLGGASAILAKTTAVWLEVSDRELYRGQKLRTDIQRIFKANQFSLAFEIRREIEGDQFYVNQRIYSTWRYLALRRLQGAAHRLFQIAAGAWRRLKP